MPLWIVTHWRLTLALALTAALGGYIAFLRIDLSITEHQRDEARAEVAAMKAAGKAQDERTKAIDGMHQAARKELEDEIERVRSDNRALLADADKRLRDNASRGFVPKSGAGPAKSVQSNCTDGERTFLAGVYLGSTVCYPSAGLDQGIRERVDRLRGRLAGLAQPAVDAFDGERWWGEWAVKVGACQAVLNSNSKPHK